MSDNMLDRSGYSEENNYINHAEAEKIQALRDKRNAQKAKLEKEMHWMKCPKCGSSMEEIELDRIMVDKCSSCNGIYFDEGELELLINHKTSETFLDRLRGFWK